MRAQSFFGVLVLLAGSVSTSSAESPHEIALRIISAEPAPTYQPKNTTDEERTKASQFNAAAQLHKFLLGDSVSEEIRVCYAMHLLVDRLLQTRDFSDSKLAKDYQESLRRDHETLVTYLRELNERPR
jgi:hypothetical protein